MTPDEEIASLRARLELREKQIDAAHRISAALSSRLDLNELLTETLDVSLQTVAATAGSILLYNPDIKRLVFKHVIGKTELIGDEIDPFAPKLGHAATVFRTGQSSIVDTRVEAYDASKDLKTGFRTSSLLTVALKNYGGEPIGVLQMLNKADEGNFEHEDQEAIEIIGGLAATSIVNAQLAEEAQLAAVARAVGDLSHDIKNALTPIEVMVDTTIEAFIAPLYEDVDSIMRAQNDVSPDEVYNLTLPLREWYPEMVVSIKDGCADIKEMVSEIADYLKGAQATNIISEDIGIVLEERLRRLRTIARGRRVEITMEEPEAVGEVPFDRRLLGRAIFNLVNNAILAIADAVKKKRLELRQEGFHVHVRLTARREGVFPEGDYCLIEVIDDGAGVPAKVLPTLFTPSVVSTTPGGTGIGTRFVKSVADAHGGLVGVESEEGNGARFWMKLPLTAKENAPK